MTPQPATYDPIATAWQPAFIAGIRELAELNDRGRLATAVQQATAAGQNVQAVRGGCYTLGDVCYLQHAKVNQADAKRAEELQADHLPLTRAQRLADRSLTRSMP